MINALGYPRTANIPALHKQLRSSRITSIYYNSKLTEADCCVCNGLVQFLQFHPHVVKHAALTPCCGAPLHKACIQTVKQYMFSCPVCRTSFWQGVPNTWVESRATSICRRLHRERNGIPSNIILPKL